jgi:hypothetical protein
MFAAIARFKRVLIWKRRMRHIELVKTFLLDASVQCARVIKMRYYRRCVIKAQRFARAFISCTRCRVRLIFLRLGKAIKTIKYESFMQKESYQRGLDIVKSQLGRHLVWSFLAKLRKVYTLSRQDFARRIRENDTTPGFTEVDIWTAKAYLTAEESPESLADEGVAVPPQYRQGNSFGPPIFKLFSRQYLENEILELVQITLGWKISEAAWQEMQQKKRQARYKAPRVFGQGKKVVRYDVPPPAKKTTRKRVVVKDKDTGEVVGADKEALALIAVLTGRLQDWKKTLLRDEEKEEAVE